MLLSNYIVSADQADASVAMGNVPCRVLLLGASVLDSNHGDVPERLNEHLAAQGAKGIRVDNFSRASHTTRDSRFKYLQLCRDYPFDVVMIYHGINDVRANNCSEEVFQEDYSHYAWYEELNVADRHLQTARFTVLPYMLDFLYHRIRQRLIPRKYIPIGEPEAEWLEQGSQIKTAPTFRENIQCIVDAARKRSARVILMTYAYYLSNPYSREAYEQGQLDYEGGGYPVELWGLASNVVKGIEVHNQVLRDIAAENFEVVLLDMERLIPKKGKYFQDVCHLSFGVGCDLMAEIIADQLIQICDDRELKKESGH